MVLLIRSPNDEDIAKAVNMKKWSSLEGAFLICRIHPIASSRPLTLADCREQETMNSQFGTAERIVSLWKSESFGAIHPSPNAFLLWCKYRNISEVDWFLERVAEVAPRFLESNDPERFSDPSRLRAACEKALAPFVLSPWGVPDVPAVEDSPTWGSVSTIGRVPAKSAKEKKPLRSYPPSGVIARAFGGCVWSQLEWSEKLKDPGTTKWLIRGRKSAGSAGTTGAHWDPVELATALYLGVKKKLTNEEIAESGSTAYFATRKVSKQRLDKIFASVELVEWREDWERKAEMLAQFGSGDSLMTY